MSNQLSDFHDDIQRLTFLPYSREKKNEYANEWDIFGSFSKLSRNVILHFFFLTQDILRTQNQVSLLLLQFVQFLS